MLHRADCGFDDDGLGEVREFEPALARWPASPATPVGRRRWAVGLPGWIVSGTGSAGGQAVSEFDRREVPPEDPVKELDTVVALLLLALVADAELVGDHPEVVFVLA